MENKLSRFKAREQGFILAFENRQNEKAPRVKVITLTLRRGLLLVYGAMVFGDTSKA